MSLLCEAKPMLSARPASWFIREADVRREVHEYDERFPQDKGGEPKRQSENKPPILMFD
jgi:hypothetical protein